MVCLALAGGEASYAFERLPVLVPLGNEIRDLRENYIVIQIPDILQIFQFGSFSMLVKNLKLHGLLPLPLLRWFARDVLTRDEVLPERLHL